MKVERGEKKARELTIGSPDGPSKLNHPGVVELVADRLADERRARLLSLQNLKEGTVGDIDIRHRPDAGKIEHLSSGVHQRQRANVRQAEVLVRQHQMRFEVGKSLLELLRRSDSGRGDPLRKARLDAINRLERGVRLRRKDKGKVLQLLFREREGALA